ncbi:hypothetical protein, partial [Mycoplasma elephantis]|uniref:hypothetical protein n=1 Tax=Mycoplasma elephantis TaxID=114882 RepID=UPI0004812AB1
MFQLSENLSKSKDNYLVRKILLLISIILICITIASLICYLFHFYNRIDQEITFLKDVDPAKIHSTKEKIESDALIN